MNSAAKNILEYNIKTYIQSLYKNGDGDNHDQFTNAPTESRLMNLMRGILAGSNSTKENNDSQILRFEENCIEKIESDIAAVVVSIHSPTFTRTTKHLKATILDKLAYIGKS